MKEGLTLYEMLDVSTDASFADIRSAFREIQSIYDKESLSTYSLFSETERQDILDRLDQAYQTLMDRDKRAVYDQSLLGTGQLSETMLFKNKANTPIPIFDPRSSQRNEQANQQIIQRITRQVKEKTGGNEFRRLRDEIQAKKEISGKDLESLRLAANVELLDIFELSRISITILEAIEGNSSDKLPPKIYLKGFLKSYAEFLDLDPELIIQGYLADCS